MFRTRFVLFLFHLLFVLFCQAQNTATVRGTVNDSVSVLAGASIRISGSNNGVSTSNTGKYHLTLKPGKYVLSVSLVGYKKLDKKFELQSGQDLVLDLTLTALNNDLELVTVSGRSAGAELKRSAFTVNAIDLKVYQNLSADLNSVLSRSTGVRVREQGGMGSDFNFSLNGLSGRQIRFFVDGVPMESFGASIGVNNIPVNLAERLEIYKGVVPVELGADALGGAVNIVTNQSISRFLDASVSHGSFNTSRLALSARTSDAKSGLFLNVNGFHNYSDNNYLMRSNPKNDALIRVVDENGNLVERDVRRFHSAYRSSMGQLAVGVTDRSWADRLELNVLYSNMYKEIQTGVTQNRVYGEVTNHENFFMPSLKYKKANFLAKGLSAAFFVSGSLTRSRVPDTANYLYTWSGKGQPNPIGAELRDIKTLYRYRNTAALAKANFSYLINADNSLNLNYNYSHFSRKATDELGNDKNNKFDEPNTIGKQVLGLAYQKRSLGGRLSSSVFAKYYNLSSLVRNSVFFASNQTYVKHDSSITNGYLGYGAATTFSLNESAGIKASYEHSYRLQEGEELFGNGIDVMANISLRPESSDNINFGGYYNFNVKGRHRFAIEASYFFRKAKDFIYFIPSGGVYSVYNNIAGAKVNGAELELRYAYLNLINFNANATYQRASSRQKYEPNTTIPDMTYGDRIPNQPWLYANAGLDIGKNDVFAKGSRLAFTWATQFVNWFYLNWESRGSVESKNQIPTQLSHNATLTYSFMQGRYNLSMEVNNVTNELLYDNFRLQKPGRAAFVKLRYFIREQK